LPKLGAEVWAEAFTLSPDSFNMAASAKVT
jgi:hypothetical protein